MNLPNVSPVGQALSWIRQATVVGRIIEPVFGRDNPGWRDGRWSFLSEGKRKGRPPGWASC